VSHWRSQRRGTKKAKQVRRSTRLPLDRQPAMVAIYDGTASVLLAAALDTIGAEKDR
jgi:hypothetical protein